MPWCTLRLTAFKNKSVRVFGEDPGAANVVKLCGNFLIAAAIESMAESLALAEKESVDREEVMTWKRGKGPPTPALSVLLRERPRFT